MTARKIFYSQIEQATCQHFRIGRGDLQCRQRDKDHFIPRAILVSLARRHTRLSYPQLGSKLLRDHTTMICAERRAKKLLGESEEFRADFVAVEKILSEGPPAGRAKETDTATREERLARAWRASLPQIPYRVDFSESAAVEN